MVSHLNLNSTCGGAVTDRRRCRVLGYLSISAYHWEWPVKKIALAVTALAAVLAAADASAAVR